MFVVGGWHMKDLNSGCQHTGRDDRKRPAVLTHRSAGAAYRRPERAVGERANSSLPCHWTWFWSPGAPWFDPSEMSLGQCGNWTRLPPPLTDAQS